MDIYIYYFGRIQADRDVIEDALDDTLSAFGGEVTGAGSGEGGGNFDLAIPESADATKARIAICEVLYSFQFGDDTKISTDDGEWLLGAAH